MDVVPARWKTPREWLEEICRPPHRLLGSEGERAAAEIAASAGRVVGGEVSVEPFRAPRDFTPWQAGTYLLALAAAHSSWVPGWMRVLVTGAALAGFVVENAARARLFSRCVPRVDTRNVVVRIPGPRPAPRRIVLLAHIDSPRSALVFHPALVRAVAGRSFPAVATGPTLGLALLFLSAIATGGGLGGSTVALARGLGSIILGVTILILAERALRGKPTNGALDNASGAAVLLSLLPDLAARAPGSEVWAVFTGAEEVGLAGAFEFLERHRNELPPGDTFVVNLEGVGVGRVGYAVSEGGVWPWRAGPRLLAACARVAAAGHPSVERTVAPSLTDAQVFLARGYEAVTLIAHDEHGGLGPYHQTTDVPAAMEDRTLEATRAFALDLVAEIERAD